jgi:glutaminase
MLSRRTTARWSVIVAALAVTLAASAARADLGVTLLDDARIDAALRAAHVKYKDLSEGKNADYIPALAQVPSSLFGIALVTADGRTFAVGDVDYQFSIQSISKVFTLAEVLQQRGEQIIVDTIGVDATGQEFNSIVAIEQNQGTEMNSFVNPGAIATTSMLKGDDEQAIWKTIIDTFSAFAGRELQVNEEVYKSESETNQRNRAIAMLMHAYGRIEDNPRRATDLYTRQCSVNVSAKDLAVMAATLANGGVNPVTKKKVLDEQYVPKVLAVMATAGLYDDSGKWLFATGLPAKSGVGGGLIAVSPGKFGIAAFSPPLDEAGNSVRAQKAIADVSAALGGNPYAVTPLGGDRPFVGASR